MKGVPTPGSVVQIRSEAWKVVRRRTTDAGAHIIECRGLSGITKSKEAQFVVELERDSLKQLDPAKVTLVPDRSPRLMETKLSLAAAFRAIPTTSKTPITLGKAAIDDLAFQHEPVIRALSQDRVRLLIADDVGLGKTLEAGLITSELALRGRADRILVVTTHSMLTQFQKEFWTRFSIPLSRLDSAAIRRMRNNIPAHYNVFDQFDRSIVSIDTLKRDGQIRDALEKSYWDLIIIDEAHNAADRKNSASKTALRAKLARLLASRADSLLLLTATPHDGSHESFASLIKMLDPTRVPDPKNLVREDIEDLVVRRFRTTPEVIESFKKTVKERRVFDRRFPLTLQEEAAYQTIADLKLDMDEEKRRGRAIDLFRTTLAKAIFSSPAACLETVEGRIKRIQNGQASGTPADVESLQTLANQVAAIEPADFSKFQDLKRLIQADLKWNGKAKRDRFVIFSERIATVNWLQERLLADLGLDDEQIARIDGGSVEADTRTQQIIEDFGQANSPIRILICSDMASEGLNLHFQCHRLIHFDLPWSLLRFQQRNGRIDRYGQDRHPEIYYFVGESDQPKVRDMWVLEKLIEKDEAAREGVGDPSVFLGEGDIQGEEVAVAEAVHQGVGAEGFDATVQAHAASRAQDDEFDVMDALLGDFSFDMGSEDETATQNTAPPRLFPDAFEYTRKMLQHLANKPNSPLNGEVTIDASARVIRFSLPDDMRATDALGYATQNTVDDRYMPPESLKDDLIELTDDAKVIDKAIADARLRERSWPAVQYLWEGHPLMHWLSDQADLFFEEHCAPLAILRGRIEPGEVAVVIHGAIPNRRGTPVVDSWSAVVLGRDGDLRIESVNDLIARARLADNTPTTAAELSDPAETPLLDRVQQLDVMANLTGRPSIGEVLSIVLDRSVQAFRTHLVDLRRTRDAQINEEMTAIRQRIDSLRARFEVHLEQQFDLLTEDVSRLKPHEIAKLNKKNRRRAEIEQVFKSWNEWHSETRETDNDPNPYVTVKAVFVGV